jgi:hypothetical protein
MDGGSLRSIPRLGGSAEPPTHPLDDAKKHAKNAQKMAAFAMIAALVQAARSVRVPIAACAAASRATGTRYGLQET